jgi:hypothetical protein
LIIVVLNFDREKAASSFDGKIAMAMTTNLSMSVKTQLNLCLTHGLQLDFGIKSTWSCTAGGDCGNTKIKGFVGIITSFLEVGIDDTTILYHYSGKLDTPRYPDRIGFWFAGRNWILFIFPGFVCHFPLRRPVATGGDTID